ncbi:MAG: S9 family peptidase [Bacteroidales bacterium]|nr:S9 family peptidase [Bacteroidales bacterium]
MRKNIFFVLAVMALCGSAIAQNKTITLEDIWSRSTFRPSGISSIRSMQDGEHYCVLTRSGIEKYNYKTGEKVDVVCAFSDPMRKKVKPLPPIESYEFSSDEQKILLSAEFEPIYRHSGVSTYYLYTVADGSIVCLTKEGKQRLTTFSPDGKMVAYVRDNNLYVMSLSSLKETAVTTDGKFNEIINGTTDWVYEEEFGITQGFYWSPDSKKIAFYRFDESKVKQYTMQMWGELYPENYTYKYPKAGEDNSVVDVMVYDLESQKTLKLNIGSQNDQYMPRIQWTQNPNILALMRMNRLQDKMELLLADATTGAIRTLYTEEDEAYVEVPETWMFLKDGKHMLLTSEKNGFNHIYMYDLNGKLVNQITDGFYDVVSICSVDEKNGIIYYLSHESSPINKELYSIDFKGKKKKKLSEKAGWYSASFSATSKYYISTFTDANTPPVYTLHTSNGKLLKTLQDNADLQQRMKEYGVGRKQFGTLTTTLGTELNYYMILPPDFDSTKRYPLFFYVYGGPGNQQVTNSYGYSDYYWFHMLAQQGYVVACFDGRGTGGRGARFKKMTYKNLGRLECEDAVEAARWFGKKQWIDESRIGIFGWSFGGYLSTLSILKGRDVFKSAIAVAPVITWRYYDNIYTERFLQRPQDNARGYDDNSPLNYAHLLKGNYLLIHGTGDDNVHFQNAVDMVTALEAAGKQFEFRIYPNKNHSIYGGNTRLNLYELMTDFIHRKL